ncbi:MAG: PEP-CTERM sorting domain-containing protein [Kiritimatiellae bacterium]|nr:PEP-CTERM sorting domain-containing protein [Kiritimatiellia bacterium]
MKSVKLIIAAAAVAIATTAMAEADSILYWMVDKPKYEDSSVAFDHVKIKAVDGGTGSYLYMFNQGASTGYDVAFAKESGDTTGGLFSGLFDGNVDYFLIELFDDSDSRVAWQRVSYQMAFDNGSISSPLAAGGATVYTISQVVPEPTSGILLLLGFAGLALRRKKA